MKQELTQEYLKSILDYNPDTGIFTWKHRDDRSNSWNTRYAGSEAGAISSECVINISINKKLYIATRLAWLYVYGYFPDYTLHYINNISLDNRIKNICKHNRMEMSQNRKKQKNNTSSFVGVCFNKYHNKFQAQIAANGKIKYLGYFNTAEEAHEAYLKAKAHYHEFA